MEHQVKHEPPFWINPNFRLNSPHFHFSWFKADMTILRQEAMVASVERKVYQTTTQCVVCMMCPDHSSLDIVYADNINFENLRLQKWLRETIRDEITARAKIVLPDRLRELERKHNLFGNRVMVKKLRGNTMGCCSVYNVERPAANKISDEMIFSEPLPRIGIVIVYLCIVKFKKWGHMLIAVAWTPRANEEKHLGKHLFVIDATGGHEVAVGGHEADASVTALAGKRGGCGRRLCAMGKK